MATVTGYSAERMKEIEDTCITEGEVINTDLWLTTRDGQTRFNAGYVMGPPGNDSTVPGPAGPVGPPGPGSTVPGPQGPPGSGGLVMAPQELLSSSPVYNATTTTDMKLDNVPVTAGHTYGVTLHSVLNWASVVNTARFDFMLQLNTVDFKRFGVWQPVQVGQQYWTVDWTVFWKPTVTRATDDLRLVVVNVNDPANLTLTGGPTIPRTLSVFDYGLI